MPEALTTSLPHKREILALVELAKEVYDKPTLILVITDTYAHGRYLLQRLGDAVIWTEEVKLHREGLEFNNGGRIVICTMDDPGRLMGMNPDKIVLFGQLGEFYYWMLSRKAEIKAVA